MSVCPHPPSPLAPRPSPPQSGLSLLEVLVTIVVLSIGLLGVSGLQVTGMKNSYSAFLRAQAAQYAHDMLDRMRVNRVAALAGKYDLAMAAPPPAGTTTLHDRDRVGWLEQVASLPEGDGAIDVTADGVATVTVQWSEAALGGGTAEFILVTEL